MFTVEYDIIEKPRSLNQQPRSQGFSRPSYFLGEKPWRRGCSAHLFLKSSTGGCDHVTAGTLVLRGFMGGGFVAYQPKQSVSDY